MNEIIKELIDVIKEMNQRDLWDYVAIIAPILLSVVAIFISIYTVRKQTKTDLFEKRYAIIYILGFLLEGTKTVLSEKIQAKDFWAMGMYNYKSINSLPESDYKNDEVLNFYFSLTLEIMKINCFFPERKLKNINKFSEAFMRYISNLFCDRDTKEDEKQLKEILDLLEKEKSIDKLDKSLKIW